MGTSTHKVWKVTICVHISPLNVTAHFTIYHSWSDPSDPEDPRSDRMVSTWLHEIFTLGHHISCAWLRSSLRVDLSDTKGCTGLVIQHSSLGLQSLTPSVSLETPWSWPDPLDILGPWSGGHGQTYHFVCHYSCSAQKYKHGMQSWSRRR